jgi:hypothetical protein
VATEAVDHLARFFFSNATVALHLIEDPCLKASYASMGVELPSRTALSTTILDCVFVEVQQQVLARTFGPATRAAAALAPDVVDTYGIMDLPVVDTTFIIITDGWSRQAALQGTPLVNLLAAGNGGHSVFLKVTTPQQMQPSIIVTQQFNAHHHVCMRVCYVTPTTAERLSAVVIGMIEEAD